MGQLYPNPVSSNQSVTINTAFPLTGGGELPLGGNLTLGISTTQSSSRAQYTVSPAPDGTTANFTVDNTATSLNISYADVYIDGFLQDPTVYTLSGNTLSFNTAPTSGQKIYAVFSQPDDDRQISDFTPSPDGVTTDFSFSTFLPLGTYVDLYLDGKLQIPSTPDTAYDYSLNIVDGVPSISFTTAPASGKVVTAVFNPSTLTGRNLYLLSPAADGTVSDFTIVGGAPSTPYIDVFAAGLFQSETVDYDLSFVSGKWTISFAAPPTSGASLCAVFAPSTTLPPSQSGGSGSGPTLETDGTPNGSQTLLNLISGTNITLTDDGLGGVTIAASGSGSYSLGAAVTTANVVLGSGAGVGATLSTVSGLDGNHYVQITTGSAPDEGATIFTFTFTDDRGHTTYPVFNTVGGIFSSFNQLPFISTSSSSSYTLSSNSTALDASTAYVWFVSCP